MRMTSLYNVTNTMIRESKRQELVASNLAGSRLAGFKGRHLVSEFGGELEQQASKNLNQQVLNDFQQGNLSFTNRPLDMAINGQGFFAVRTEQDVLLLTRNGSFTLNNDRELVTQEGHIVESDGGGAIEIPINNTVNDLTVAEDGTLRITQPNGADLDLGKLQISKPEDETQMTRLSANYFYIDERQLDEAENFKVSNKTIETANVSTIREMTTMIASAREFEMGQKILKMYDQLSSREQQHLSL